MLIKITKKSERNQLSCMRDDGSYTLADLGPSLPFHDIAHFVMEKNFKIKNGFYGSIEKGYSIEQLSDAAVIKTLGFESWLAEILARGLQTLLSGACLSDQFIWQVTTEIEQLDRTYHLELNDEIINNVFQEYKNLIEKWNAIADGETLELHFTAQEQLIS